MVHYNLKNMRKFFIILLVLISFGTAYASQKDTLRILAIGNSFSVDAVEAHLYGLFESEGIDVIIGNLYIGGCSLERHYNNTVSGAKDYSYRKIVKGKKTTVDNVDIDKALLDEPWDFISFQQSSPLSGKANSISPYLENLMAYVDAKVDNDYKTIWHMTWAYSKDSDHNAFPDYDKDQIKMYNAIVDVVKNEISKYNFDIIIPCGTTIQNARSSYLGDSMTRDGYHLDKKKGRYAAACTWFEAITSKSVVGNTFYPKGVDERCAKTCQLAAHKAMRKAYKVSKIK